MQHLFLKLCVFVHKSTNAPATINNHQQQQQRSNHHARAIEQQTRSSDHMHMCRMFCVYLHSVSAASATDARNSSSLSLRIFFLSKSSVC